MKVIGITGGVGSGKSRVLHILETEYQAYIIEADRLAHKLMEPGEAAYQDILSVFGRDILAEDGSIDRKRFGDMVFGDEKKLACLNGIVHPAVKREIVRQIAEKKAEGSTEFFVIEAALLLQDGYREICDEIWFVQVDREERIKRLMKQRSYTEEKCAAIFDSQPGDDYYRQGSDIVIDNNGDFNNVCKNIRNRLQCRQ
jgi:dephospho-CoA kinase